MACAVSLDLALLSSECNSHGHSLKYPIEREQNISESEAEVEEIGYLTCSESEENFDVCIAFWSSLSAGKKAAIIQAEECLVTLENIGMKDARQMLAKIQRGEAEITALTKRINNLEKDLLGDLGVSMLGDQNIVITIPLVGPKADNLAKGLFSHPFYLEKYRYKARLQVCMNDSGEQGGSLSVFVHIIKGDFDSILDWPFIHMFAIKVKNQKKREDDIVNTLQPVSIGIQKPEVDRNITFGSRNFELVTERFIKDDSIDIECEVLWKCM